MPFFKLADNVSIQMIKPCYLDFTYFLAIWRFTDQNCPAY